MSFAWRNGKGFKGWLHLGVGFWVGLKSARVSVVAGGHLRAASVNRSSVVWEYGGFWFRSWFWCWCWGLEYGLCLFGNRRGVSIGSEGNCVQQLHIALSPPIDLKQISANILSFLVGYWSGFVMLLVWVCSMSAACNASRTTGEQTQCQHHDKLSSNTPALNLGSMVGFWFRSWFWCWCWGLEYGLCLFGNRRGVAIGSKGNCVQQLRIALSPPIDL